MGWGGEGGGGGGRGAACMQSRRCLGPHMHARRCASPRKHPTCALSRVRVSCGDAIQLLGC